MLSLGNLSQKARAKIEAATAEMANEDAPRGTESSISALTASLEAAKLKAAVLLLIYT